MFKFASKFISSFTSYGRILLFVFLLLLPGLALAQEAGNQHLAQESGQQSGQQSGQESGQESGQVQQSQAALGGVGASNSTHSSVEPKQQDQMQVLEQPKQPKQASAEALTNEGPKQAQNRPQNRLQKRLQDIQNSRLRQEPQQGAPRPHNSPWSTQKQQVMLM